MSVKRIVAICIAFLLSACRADYTVNVNPDIVMFSQENYTLGVMDSEEWLEIPISATKVVDYDRNIGVEVLWSESSAIEGLHYVVESNTLTIPKGELTTALRIRGIAENIAVGEELTICFNLVLDQENVSEIYGTRSEVKLQRCCKFDINNFVGYAKITSTWTMQYMNSDARLVRTELGKKENSIVVKDMFYSREDYRVEQRTDYEKLNLEITTDGSIKPKEALKEAAKILIQHFMLFSDEKMTINLDEVSSEAELNEPELHMRQLLKTKLVDKDLSVRALNCLKAADVETIGDLVKLNRNDLLKFRNFGKKSLTELDALLASLDLKFGMDVSIYKLDKE